MYSEVVRRTSLPKDVVLQPKGQGSVREPELRNHGGAMRNFRPYWQGLGAGDEPRLWNHGGTMQMPSLRVEAGNGTEQQGEGNHGVAMHDQRLTKG
jgi:hypothetical protein